MKTEKQYWAFISYSAKDKRWGEWLHRRLENYPIPSEFQGLEVFDGAVLGKNLRPIFRDRDELAGSSDLGAAIHGALLASRFLVVLCSKNAAKSQWVNKEIKEFQSMGKGSRILTLILDGEPNATAKGRADEECFPPALRYPVEPIAGDLRKEGDGKERGFLKVLAGVAQLDFAELYRRHERAQAKKRLILGMVAVCLIVLFAGLSGYAWEQSKIANAKEKEVRIRSSRSDFLIACEKVEQSQPSVALAYLARAIETNPGNNIAKIRAFTLCQQLGGIQLLALLNHQDGINSAVFRSDGKQILTVSMDDTARVWDAEKGIPISKPMKHESVIVSATLSPDETRTLTVDRNKIAKVWDSKTGTLVGVLAENKENVSLAVFNDNSKRILTVTKDNTARVWDATSGNPTGEPIRHEEPIRSAEFSPDGRCIVTASDDKTARVWDATSGTPIGELIRHEESIRSAKFSPDGRCIVTASDDKTARVWDVTGKPLSEPMRHDTGVSSAVFSPDGNRIITTDSDCTAQIWCSDTGKAISKPMKHSSRIRDAIFSYDGKRVLTVTSAMTTRVWDATSGDAISEPMRHESMSCFPECSRDSKRFVTVPNEDSSAKIWNTGETIMSIVPNLRHKEKIKSVRFSLDGQKIVTASWDKTAQVWDSNTGTPLGGALNHVNYTYFADFSPDGRRVVTLSEDTTVRIWSSEVVQTFCEPLMYENDVFSNNGKRIRIDPWDGTAEIFETKTGQTIGNPLRHERQILSANFSSDGKRIVTASLDHTARVWDAETGMPISKSIRHNSTVKSAVFSPDGKRIATASEDGTAQIWDSETGQSIGETMRHTSVIFPYVNSIVFSPNGKLIVTASNDNTARIWGADTGQQIGLPMWHKTWVLSAVFSPDSRRVVTVSDNAARVWDVETGKMISAPLQHKDIIKSVVFSPDGKRILTASMDRTARVWDATTGMPIAEFMRHENCVISADFSPDGTHILTIDNEKNKLVWDDCGQYNWEDVDTDVFCKILIAVAGMRLDDSQNLVLEKLSSQEILTIRTDLMKYVETPVTGIIVRYLLLPYLERPISIFGKATIGDHLKAHPKCILRYSQENNLSMIANCLDVGIDINTTDEKGRTALLIAANNPGIVDYLCRRYEYQVNGTEEVTPTVNHKNLAHAYLFNGHFEKAKTIYVKYLGTAFANGRKWNDEVRNDFKTLRVAGRDHPDMKKIEVLLNLEP